MDSFERALLVTVFKVAMNDDMGAELARQMVVTLPRFGIWALWFQEVQ
ncbi:MAG: hypothetical protein ACR2J8_11620 [Thermomicrobiales bacterium]